MAMWNGGGEIDPERKLKQDPNKAGYARVKQDAFTLAYPAQYL